MPETIEQARNREAWLTDFLLKAIPYIREKAGLGIDPSRVKLSCGFPSRGGRARKNTTVGECFHTAITGGERKYFQLFIHPKLVEPVEIGETVIHEVLHAMLPAGVGHRKPFSQASAKVGFEGPPTRNHAGEELAEKIKQWAEELGPYPHESLSAFGGPKQTTRLIKVMCKDCGYTIRVTYKWLDEGGAPICPICNEQMEESGVGEDVEAQLPLIPIEQNVEYKVRAIKKFLGDRATYDPRWSVFMTRKARVVHWWVLDYGEPVDETGKAVLGVVNALRTIAESRADAIALLEALREGTMTYDDIEARDHEEPEDEEDFGDLGDWEEDDPYLGDEEHEILDVPEEEDDPRFQWEIDRGIPVESIDPEAEREKREGWVNPKEDD